MKRLIWIAVLAALTVWVAFAAHATVTSTSPSVSYTCAGTTGPFVFSFGILDTSDLTVTKTPSGGAGTVLTETTDYAVSCTNNDCTSGGSVTLVASCASSSTLTLERVTPRTQASSFTEGMATLYGTFETGLDKLTMMVQEQDRKILTTGGVPGGTTGQLQYNNLGAFGGWSVGAGLTVTAGSLVATGTTPGGSNTHVQYNQAGAFGGDSGFTYDSSTHSLTITGSVDLNSSSGAITKTGTRAFYVSPLDDDEGESTANTLIGMDAGKTITVGGESTHDTAVGYQALYSEASGYGNVAIGGLALHTNTTGYGNIAIGYFPMYSNVSGTHNIGIGFEALYSNTVAAPYEINASYNIGIGYHALYANTIGGYNTALGSWALASNTEGLDNTAAGYNSLQSVETGNRNTGAGVETLVGLTSGSGNTALGYQTLYGVQTGSYNTGMGYYNFYTNTSGDYNVVIGAHAGFYEADGSSNKLIIHSSNLTDSSTPLIYGDFSERYLKIDGDLSFGSGAGGGSTIGSSNIIGGNSAAALSTVGDSNLILGSNNTSGSTVYDYNVFIGPDTNKNVTWNDTSNYSIGIGYGVLSGSSPDVSSGYQIVMGTSSLTDTYLTGAHNIVLGDYSHQTGFIGAGNITIGSYQHYRDKRNLSNQLTISPGITVTATPLIEGNSSDDWVRVHGNLEVYNEDYSGSLTESLTNTALTGGTDWSATTDCSLASDKATCTYSAGTASTIVQASGTMAHAGKGLRMYQFTYTVSGSVGSPTVTIPTAFAYKAVKLNMYNGTHNLYFVSAASPSDFTISTTLTTGQAFSLDDLKLSELLSGDVIYGGSLATTSASAPSTASATPSTTTIYGSNTATMGTPTKWISVKIDGVEYKVPAY